LQNHDQVGNRAFGERLHHQLDQDLYRAASTLLLFLPYVPLLFMGQEFAASSPFQYFTDHTPELGRLVTEGRRREFAAFSHFADPATRDRIPDPQAESTFISSKLRLADADTPFGGAMQSLYTRLISLRREDPVLREQARERLAARALAQDALGIRRWRERQERLLLVNFGGVARRFDEYGGGWRVLLDSGAATRPDPSAVVVGAHSASILARDQA
jgi:maltooligosyltrehalose trehalohydrolase